MHRKHPVVEQITVVLWVDPIDPDSTVAHSKEQIFIVVTAKYTILFSRNVVEKNAIHLLIVI